MKFYCGIDLGKYKVDITVMDESGQNLKRTRLDSDIQAILKWLGQFPKDINIVFETCGTYYWLSDGLRDAGYLNLTMAHTLRLKAITDAKIKTDKRDSRVLADLHRATLIPEAYIFPEDGRQYRDLARRRLSLVRKRASHFKELKMMLTRHGCSAPSRNDIQTLDDSDLEEYLGHDLHLDFMIKQTVAIMNVYTMSIKEIEVELESLLQTDDLTERLMEIPGVGKTLSKTLRLEIGEISRFKNPKQFSSWCRVVPSLSQSGGSSKRGGGSKQGNAFMKNALMQAASAAIRLNPQIRAYREFHVQRRRGSSGRLVTTNIIAHKIAIAVFYIFNGRRFDIDKLFNIEGLCHSI